MDAAAYKEKLLLSSGDYLPDPYSVADSQWSCDVSLWPKLEWPDIYTYLVERPSVYTKEKLRAYKSLDAYNYVLCGHVQQVEYFRPCDSDFCVVRAKVLPSQRQGQKTSMYSAWAIIHQDKSYVLSANCTCMAG